MIQLNGIEFFNFEDMVFYRLSDGTQHELTEKSEMVGVLFNHISNFYPEAIQKLEERYSKLSLNIPHYRYRIVKLFCKCNFGEIDNVPDVDCDGVMRFEHIPCPMRGECPMENIVCHPKFSSCISDAEMRVLNLLYDGCCRADIADKLYLSPHTVLNHIKNAFRRIGVHSEAEFISYANKHNLFKVM